MWRFKSFIFQQVVLITGENLTCKICDFGSSRFGNQTTKMTIAGVNTTRLFTFLCKIALKDNFLSRRFLGWVQR